MMYDKARMTKLGVDPSQYSWYGANHARPSMDSIPATPAVDPEEAKLTKTARRRSITGFVLAVVFLMWTATLGPIVNGHLPSFDGWTVFLIVSLSVGVGLVTIPRLWSLLIPVFAVLVWNLIFNRNLLFDGGLWLLLLGSPITTFIWGMQALLSGIINSRKLKGRSAHSAPRGPVADTYGFVYGQPGGVAGSVGKFSQANLAAGVAGEESTAFLLETLLKDIPGVTILHGLRFPGSQNADVDHAVVCGNRVIFIDSKQFASGTYSWERVPDSTTILGGKVPYQNHMAAALDGYGRKLPDSCVFDCVVLIHGRSIKTDPTAQVSQEVALFNAHEGMDYIGRELAAESASWPDVYSKGVLVSSLKG